MVLRAPGHTPNPAGPQSSKPSCSCSDTNTKADTLLTIGCQIKPDRKEPAHKTKMLHNSACSADAREALCYGSPYVHHTSQLPDHYPQQLMLAKGLVRKNKLERHRPTSSRQDIHRLPQTRTDCCKSPRITALLFVYCIHHADQLQGHLAKS